jgi:membrane protein
MSRLKAVFGMLKEAAADWSQDNAPRLGAALSYYTIFSLAPLLLISIGVAGLFFGQEAAQGRIVHQIDGLLGTDGAKTVEEMLENARKPATGTLATMAGFVTLIFGATGAFTELRSSLNTVWEVETPPTRGIFGMVKARFLSFTLVLGVGFLLLVSLVVSAALAAAGSLLDGRLPGGDAVLQALNFVVSLAAVTLLFAMIYKLLPDTHVEWHDVWFGAGVTAALFTLGKTLIGLYLGRSSVGSAYGAAGSLVIILVWVYYAAQILFFGAELTQVYARRHGSRIGSEEDPS